MRGHYLDKSVTLLSPWSPECSTQTDIGGYDDALDFGFLNLDSSISGFPSSPAFSSLVLSLMTKPCFLT